MDWYPVWWPWLTSKRSARFDSDSWVSCVCRHLCVWCRRQCCIQAEVLMALIYWWAVELDGYRFSARYWIQISGTCYVSGSGFCRPFVCLSVCPFWAHKFSNWKIKFGGNILIIVCLISPLLDSRSKVPNEYSNQQLKEVGSRVVNFGF